MASVAITRLGNGRAGAKRPEEVRPTKTFAPAAINCSATSTANDPPMVRGTTPHRTPCRRTATIGV
jgi:hypothetical protein